MFRSLSLVISTLALLLMAGGCDKLGGGAKMTPDYYSFATLHLDEENPDACTFMNDAGKTLIPEEFRVSATRLRDGQRMVVFFDALEDVGPGHDKDNLRIKVYRVDTCVTVGATAVVETQDGLREFGTNGTSVNLAPNYPQSSGKYFNIYVGYNAGDPSAHSFTLAHVLDDPGEGRFLNLVLCHEDNGDTSPREYWEWLSFPVADFEERLEGKSRVKIAIKTRTSGIKTVEIDLSD